MSIFRATRMQSSKVSAIGLDLACPFSDEHRASHPKGYTHTHTHTHTHRLSTGCGAHRNLGILFCGWVRRAATAYYSVSTESLSDPATLRRRPWFWGTHQGLGKGRAGERMLATNDLQKTRRPGPPHRCESTHCPPEVKICALLVAPRPLFFFFFLLPWMRSIAARLMWPTQGRSQSGMQGRVTRRTRTGRQTGVSMTGRTPPCLRPFAAHLSSPR
ncbi:hypothetical protein LX36DRAFT_29888 [Colletotrichum falcatum]|nr:hypothetical protein LX36DRAFT_29888 [Colletotrichum falcatum]